MVGFIPILRKSYLVHDRAAIIIKMTHSAVKRRQIFGIHITLRKLNRRWTDFNQSTSGRTIGELYFCYDLDFLTKLLSTESDGHIMSRKRLHGNIRFSKQ